MKGLGKRIPVGSLVLIFFVLALLYSMKLHYSMASVNELDWILFPTTKLVEGITGIHFQKEAFTGYVNWDVQVIIAKSCAGINFMIVLLAMFVIIIVKQPNSPMKKWVSLPLLCIISYVITIFANAIRIIFSIYCFQLNIFSHWLTRERFHHITGILFFFTFLSIIYHFSWGVITPKKNTPIYVLPLLCYVAVTIGVPLIRSPRLHSNPLFIEHSIIILLVSLIVLTLTLWVAKIFSTEKK